MVNSAINSAVESQWRVDIKMKSSLRYINPDSVSVGAAHNVWTSVHDNIHDSRRAQLCFHFRFVSLGPTEDANNIL